MIFILFLLKNFIASNFHRVLLIDKPPVDMNCLAAQGATNNGFFGTQYFYQSLSNQGQIQSINEITFTGFIQFKNYNQNKGKQVIFNFVDGLFNDIETQPYINLGLAILYQNNQLKLQVLSGVPSEYNLVKQELVIGYSNTDKMIQQWYHFVVSVNIQTDKLQFLNLKFYHMQTNSFYNFQTPYIQNNTFSFQFSPFSRITNEQIVGYDLDSRLCGYLAKFTYYAGYSTMDQELYLDYYSEPILLVRPQPNSLASSTSNNIKIIKSVNYKIELSKIKIGKTTQVIYELPQAYDNITLSFWLNISIVEEFQILSFLEIDQQSMCIGLNVDQDGQLILQSQQQKIYMGKLADQDYNQISLSFIRRAYSINFDPDPVSTMVRLVQNGNDMGYQTLQSVTNYKYFLLGFLNQQNKDSQYIYIYDVRLYQGFSIHLINKYDCFFKIERANQSPCLYCSDEKNSLCTESPSANNNQNIASYSNCPAGYQELPGCPQITISNCARQSGTKCTLCFVGYSLQNNKCNSKNQFILTPQDCSFSSALFCQIINRNFITKVCENNLQYRNNKCITNDAYFPGTCSHSYQVNGTFLGCFNCVLGTFNKGFLCLDSCAESTNNPKAYRFATSNWCEQTCPKYYDYYRNCSISQTFGSCVSSCSTGQQLNGITCLYPKQNKMLGYTESCWFQSISATDYIENWKRVLKCDDSCKYCFHSGPYSCLSCTNQNQFFDPLLSRCVDICDTNTLLPYSDYTTMQCVGSCGSKLTTGYICSLQCPSGYVKYTNYCVDVNSKPKGTYIYQNQCLRCPDICLECDSPNLCTSCQGGYFLINGNCQLTCNPLIYYQETQQCVTTCPPNSYTYNNLNLNGYSVQICFQDGCSQIWAGQQFNTFLHQSIPYQCVISCDTGYYGSLQAQKCIPCSGSCQTCLSSIACLTCIPGLFLSKTQCFQTCPTIMDYTTWRCVPECPDGTFVLEKARACLAECGKQYLPAYKLVYENNCYDTPPPGIGCDAQNQCYICDPACITCNGPTDQNCLSCHPNTYLLGNVCGNDCDTLQYDMKTWMCSNTCSVGTYKQGQYCSFTCMTGYYQFGTACYESTPPGGFCLFSTSKLMYLCDPCYKGCATCTGNQPDQCNSCLNKYYYYQNVCYQTCPQIMPVMDSFTNQCKSTCPAPYFLQDNVCQTSCTVLTYKVPGLNVCFTNACGNGYYAKSGLPGCQVCNLGCYQCKTTSTNCRACSLNYFLTGSTCVTQCPPQTPYHNQISQKCVTKCETSAFTYINQLTSQTYCLASCPLYQYGIQCYDECPVMYFPNPKICQKCYQQCAHCIGPKLNQCTACIMGLFLNDSQCVSQCPDNKPLDIATKTCSSECLGYIFLVQGVCLASCPSYLYYYTLNNKKECVQKCYDGSFNKNQNCIACAPECINCYGTSVNQCTVCNKGYYFLQNQCLGACPSNYYSNMIDFSCVQICPPELYIWQKQCLFRCPNLQFNYGQYCLLQCPSYSFIRGSECIDCDPQCVQCNGPTNQECDKCTKNFYLDQNTCSTQCPQYYDDQLNTCVDQCDSNQYLIEDTLRCVSVCPINYLTSNRNCVYQCPQGQYLQGNNCLDCDSKCSQCIGQATICTACKQNFVLDINTCSQSCSDTQLFIDNINRVCQSRCPIGLYHFQPPLTNKRFCVQTCQLQYDQFCVDECPQQYYNKAGDCTKCPFQCIACTSLNNCQQCVDGYYLNTINSLSSCESSCSPRLTDLQNMECVDQCNNSQVQYNDDCLSNCPTNPPLLQYKQSCLLDCPNGSYRDNNQCFSCDQFCSQCYGSTNTQCVSCKNGYYLNGNQCTDDCGLELADMVNNQCVKTCGSLLVQDGQTCKSECQIVQYQKICYDECPLKTFQMNKYCVDCQLNCSKCNQYGCLECENGFLSNYQCGTFCQLYYDETTLKCVDSCPVNSVQLLDHCLDKCPQPYYQYQQKCLLDCPLSTYSDINHQCQDCQERCLKCDIQNNCLVCNDGYYLYQNRCVIQCPIQQQYMDTIYGVCRQSCPQNSFIKGYHCVSECNQLILNNQCLDQCLDGYYQNEQFCNQCQSRCSTCQSINVCNSCKANYYLDDQQCNQTCQNIMNQKLWQCTDTCDGYLSNNICYDKCPLNLLQFQQSCVNKCPTGYYQEGIICTKCPSQCVSCQDSKVCYNCSIGYYLNQNECITECPIGQYGNPSILQCVNLCPSGTFKYQQQCVFDCPKPYLQSNDLCQTQCNQNQFRNGWKCFDCSIECNQCKDFGNDQCIDCNQGFVLDELNNKCVGECPQGYYLNGSCYQCPFQCQSCDKNGCLLCKGDRQLNDNNKCQCNIGYFDDEKQEQCQKCPCLECTSFYNCTKCINNLQPPNCSCNKQLNDEYCISCQVAQVNIYFTNSLNQIIIDFDLLINVNVFNPFYLNDCKNWFNNSDLLGINSQCYLNWNRTQIIINLGKQSTVNVNDTLLFQTKMFKYVNDEQCSDFIELFIDSTVKGPSIYIQPNIEFDNMPKISICMDNIIKQISINGTGNREVKILQWELNKFSDEEHYQQMKDFFNFQKDYLIIPQQTLRANFTYEIIVTFINFLNENNQYLLVIQTMSTGIPFAYFNKDSLSINIFIYDCITTYRDMDGPFYLNYQIYYKEKLLQQNIYNSSKTEYFIPYYDLPKGIRLAINIYNKDQNTLTYFTIPLQDYNLNFTKSDRFVGSQFQIEGLAYDLDINQTELQSYGFSYEWRCMIRYSLIPCKNRENKIYTFPNSKKISVNLDITNLTLVFYLKVSKQDRFKISSQTVIVTDQNEEYQLFEKNSEIDGYINRRTTVSLQFNELKQSVFILQDDQIIYSNKIQTSSLRFTFSDIAISKNPIIIYLLPGQQSIRFALNEEPEILDFNINPKYGKSLDRFTYNIGINEKVKQQPYYYSLYYYLLSSTLEEDLNQQSNINGIPIIINSLLNHGNFTLPSNIAGQNITILLEVKANKGSYSISTNNIKISEDSIAIKDLNQKIIGFYEQNNNTIIDIFNGVQLYKSQTQQVCLKQCSGVGTCINKVCNCPIGYYFEDCSGTEQDYYQFQQLFKSIYQQVLNSSIDYNNYVLYIRLINYLKQFKFLQVDNMDQQMILLDNLNNNIKYKLNQINNYSIGLLSQNNSEYNYNQMDTKSIVNKFDLQTTINLTTIGWTYLLNNFTQYEMQYKLRILLQNTIELYLTALLPDESANLTYDACKIIINRTNNTNILINKNKRLLSQNIQYYDIIQVIYIKNLYCNDGYYPYIAQCNIVYDYQIRQMNRLYNIQLNTTINYTFNIDNSQFSLYVCIQRDQMSYQWTNQYCTTSIIKNILYCNCSILAPTTFIKDYQLIYTNPDLYHFTLPNIIIFGYLGQFMILFFIYFISKARIQDKLQQFSILKFGHINKLRRGRFSFKEIQQEDQNQEIKDEQEIKDQQQIQFQESDFKFHLNNFYKYHYLLKVIFRQKEYLPVSYRLLVIWFRWSLSMALISLFTDQLLTFYIAIHPALGITIILRVACQGFEQSYKRTTILKEYIQLFLILLTLFLVLIFSTVLIVYQTFQMTDQTDWFLSYYISFFIDNLIVDFIMFIIQKYLGFEIREQFKKKIKQIKQIQQLRRANRQHDF